MSTKYLFAAIQSKTQDPIAKIILIYLADSANNEGKCYPSHSTIADMCETSVKTVKRKLDDLLVMGFIEWENRGHKGYKTSNLYTLCEPEVMLINGLVKGSERRVKNEARIGQADLTDRSQRPIEPISNLLTTTTKGKPSVEDVQAYVNTRKIKIDAQRFIDYYSANGWKVGRNAMKDWQASVRTWEAREKSSPAGATTARSTKSTTLQQDLTDTSWA